MSRPTSQLWRQLAKNMLNNERALRPLHNHPSTGCLVRWRDRVLVGMVQHPVDAQYPHIVFVSVTSRYFDPDYVSAIRELDSGRLELTASPRLEMAGANFHVMHREGDLLSHLTADETNAVRRIRKLLIEINSINGGAAMKPVIHKHIHSDSEGMS